MDILARALTSATQVNATNLVANGDFSKGSASWSGIDTVVSGIAEKIATAQYGCITQDLRNPTSYANHIVYASALVKSTSTSVGITITDGAAASTKYHDGSNTFIRLSVLKTVPASPSLLYAKVQDNRASGWDKFYVDNYIFIDLTVTFGAGAEPSVAQMDEMLSYYPNSWFNGTVNLANNSKKLPYILSSLRSKASAVQEAWITPTLLNGATTDSANPIMYRKNQFGIIEFKGRATITSGNNAIVMPSGYRLASTRTAKFATANDSSSFAVITVIGYNIYASTGLIDFSNLRYSAEE